MSKEQTGDVAIAGTPGSVGEGSRTDAMTQPEVDSLMESLPANRRVPAFYAFTFRNFRLFFYGQSISVAGTWMQTVAQQWLVWQLTRSAVWLGIVNGASAVPFVLFALWGGHIADRYPRRAILIWTQAISMGLAFVLAVLATNHPIRVQAWHVALLAGLMGVVNAFNMPAQQAFVTDMVDEREALGNAIALNSLRFNLARVLGPMLAGLVLVKFNVAACFALNGLSYVAVIISLWMMRLPAFTLQDRSVSVWEGFRYIARNRSILRTVMLVGFGAIFTWSVSTLFPVFAAMFKKGAQGFSWMMSANGVGAALAGLLLAALGSRLPRRTLVYGGALLFCVALLLLSVAGNYWLALACLALSGFAMIVFGISANTKVQEDAPDTLRGRVMAVYSLVFQGLFPVGGLEVGFLAQRYNAIAAVRFNATICLIATLALLAWSLSERRRDDPLPLA